MFNYFGGEVIFVQNLSKLAMLDVSDAENLQQDIMEIIQMAQGLADVDTKMPAPFEEGVFRDDEAQKSFEREDMLKNAPCVKNGFIVVPKTVG